MHASLYRSCYRGCSNTCEPLGSLLSRARKGQKPVVVYVCAQYCRVFRGCSHPRVFRAGARILELREGHSLSLNAAFRKVAREFSLAPGKQRAAYLLVNRVSLQPGPAIFILEKHKKLTLPLRRRASFLAAFHLVRSVPGMQAKVKAARGGLLSDSLLGLLSGKSVEKALGEIEELLRRLAYSESAPPLLLESLLARLGRRKP